MQPGPDPIAAPLREAPVDRRPGRPEHRWQLPPGAPRRRHEDDRGQAFAVTRPPPAATLRAYDLPQRNHPPKQPPQLLRHQPLPQIRHALLNEGPRHQKRRLRQLVRRAEGRDAEPSACVLDAQSVKTSANVPATGQGIDAGKKIAGRKRHIGVDTLGLLLAVWVTAASLSDNAGGIHLLSRIAQTHPRIAKAWADSGYRTKVIDHGATLGIDVEVVQRAPDTKGFTVIPRRWVVERTFGWLMHHRRLARDYETHPHRSEAMIHLAMIDLISRRLTRESTPNWRDT
jgi:transposase